MHTPSGSNNRQIFKSPTTGSDLTGTLLSQPNSDLSYTDEQPAWSPDGTKIAFISTAGRQNSDILTMNATNGIEPEQPDRQLGPRTQWPVTRHGRRMVPALRSRPPRRWASRQQPAIEHLDDHRRRCQTSK